MSQSAAKGKKKKKNSGREPPPPTGLNEFKLMNSLWPDFCALCQHNASPTLKPKTFLSPTRWQDPLKKQNNNPYLKLLNNVWHNVCFWGYIIIIAVVQWCATCNGVWCVILKSASWVWISLLYVSKQQSTARPVLGQKKACLGITWPISVHFEEEGAGATANV